MQTNMAREGLQNGSKNGATDHAGTLAPETRVLVPSVDVLESAEEILVLADLPGVRPDDLTLHLEKETLSLVAERKGSAHARPVQYRRTFQVPSDLDPDGIEARTECGVLTLRFPRRASAKPRNIAVKSRG
jgi:HSP20 family protein